MTLAMVFLSYVLLVTALSLLNAVLYLFGILKLPRYKLEAENWGSQWAIWSFFSIGFSHEVVAKNGNIYVAVMSFGKCRRLDPTCLKQISQKDYNESFGLEVTEEHKQADKQMRQRFEDNN